MSYLLLLFYCTLYAALNVVGSAFIKRELSFIKLIGAMDYVFFLFRPLVILGISIIFVAMLTMFKAPSIFKFSIVGPIATGINMSLTILIGVYFFEERLSWPQYAGLVFILAGVTLVAVAKK